MNDRDPLTRLLGTSGEDAGCEGGMALLAVYVEEELAGRTVAQVLGHGREEVAHLPACAEDYQGLIALAREQRG